MVISRLKPVTLCEIIVAASSEEAYEWASSHVSAVEEALCRERLVLRQGDVLFMESHRFRLVMLQPVLQGVAKAGQTELLLIRPDTSHPDDTVDTVSLSGTDEEGIEIGEEFLADDHFAISPPTSNGNADLSCPTFKPEPLSSQLPPFTNDFTVGIRTSDLSRIGVCTGDWV